MTAAMANFIPSGLDVIPLREDFWIGVRRLSDAAGPAFQPKTEALLLTFPLDTAKESSTMATLSVVRHERPVTSEHGGQIFIAMELRLLRTILGDDQETLPLAVRRLVHEPSKTVLRLPPTPEQLVVARAIRDCPFSGAVRNIYLKSKALELIASLFGQFHAQESGRQRNVPLSADTAPFLKARDILAKNLESPPRLRDLAVQVGMGETRLKRGFKLLFGAPPYEWLHENRLVTARELLLQPGASVSQVAYRVGYTNVSHFIAAFVRRFGARPGELLRLTRQGELHARPNPPSTPTGTQPADL